jgi:hypothetical protein
VNRTYLLLLQAFVLLQSCRGVKTLPGDYTAQQERERSYMIAIFMDGTRDKPHSNVKKNTHVKSVHALAFSNLRTLYVEGVGAGNRLKQAAKGTTTNKRIMKAYRFLVENYRPGDSICLFGFSRGANQCRILSSFIYTIGIVDLSKIRKTTDKQQLLLDLYDQYLDTLDAPGRKHKLSNFINNWNRLHTGEEIKYDTSGKTTIELMGLWDTVEALEVGDTLEKITPISTHLNQLYNVKKLFHAVSLDDNRAFNYTPILATHRSVELHANQNINDIVEEVWFNGSHKDIGGGHNKRAQLEGISLQWMLSKVKPYHIFRDTIPVINTYGVVNNMRRTALLRKLSPGDTLRGINKYWDSMNLGYNYHRIKVHQSVIDRLAAGMIQDFKIKNGRLDWYDWEPFSKCFIKDGMKRIMRKDCSCIEVVN